MCADRKQSFVAELVRALQQTQFHQSGMKRDEARGALRLEVLDGLANNPALGRIERSQVEIVDALILVQHQVGDFQLRNLGGTHAREDHDDVGPVDVVLLERGPGWLLRTRLWPVKVGMLNSLRLSSSVKLSRSNDAVFSLPINWKAGSSPWKKPAFFAHFQKQRTALM